MIPTTDIMMYGFSKDECSRVESVLPNSESQIVRLPHDCFTDILAVSACAVIVNAGCTEVEDMQTLFEYYTEVNDFSEAVILVGDVEIPHALIKKVSVYENFDSMMRDIKYLLLSASRREKKYETFSRSLANAIMILSEIRRNPGVTTAQLSEKLEMSPRSVQRYIETLRVAGEWIIYDQSTRGWKLTEGKSVLWGDI